MTEQEKTALQLEASGMAVGESMRTTCPQCGKPELSLTRTNMGLLYHCYRASCSTAGFIATVGQLLQSTRSSAPSNTDPYTGPLYSLTSADIGYFSSHYEIDPDVSIRHIYYTEDGRYVLPMRDRQNRERGVVLRKPWPGAPRSTGYPGPKARVYLSHDLPAMSVYRDPAATGKTVILVEDQLSAIKASQLPGVAWAVALIGTHIEQDRAREIAMLPHQRVVIALDADATSTAFKLARRWGLAWKQTRVALLRRDLKDTPLDDIAGVLGLDDCHN
jgi:hypothetical protein